MLEDETLFFGSVWHPDKGITDPKYWLAIGVYVNVNDIFAWAQAEGERVKFKEIEDLYRHWKKDPKWGSAVWACKKRNMQPQEPVKKAMIKDGSWKEDLETLEENYYDKKCREMMEKKHGKK